MTLGLLERAVVQRLVDRVTQLRRMLFGLRRTLSAKERQSVEAARRAARPSNAPDRPLTA